ncbi:hypothetical protein [Streptomyces griseorubiginosus]|uniref:hypothetical protein n=1 Tax=Streptomyces griseorubiginosus TaxID=67304 RepID=UPI0036E9A70F
MDADTVNRELCIARRAIGCCRRQGWTDGEQSAADSAVAPLTGNSGGPPYDPSTVFQNGAVTEKAGDAEKERVFRECVAEVARLIGVDVDRPGRARSLAGAVRRPLLERSHPPEELFAPLMAAAVHDPDPSFCRWFVEPALYCFGRRRVLEALVEYLRTGTDLERAGATRAWYWAHMPLRTDRSPACTPDGTRDPAMDISQDAKDAWLEVSMQVLAEATDVRIRNRVLNTLPNSPEAYPPRLQDLFERFLSAARTAPDDNTRRWARAVDRARS